MTKFPSKKEFDCYELKRPDFRTRFWRRWKVYSICPIGSREWWAWVSAGIEREKDEARMVHHCLGRFLTQIKRPLPLSPGSGRVVKFTRLLPLEKI